MASKGKKTPARTKKGRRRAGAAESASRPVAVTTFRVYRDQLLALKRLALDRTAEGGGRADASAVLREMLDRELGR